MKNPVIKHLEPIRLIGIKTLNRQNDDQTQNLWKRFMIHRKDIAGRINQLYYAVQEYHGRLEINRFTLDTEFTIWAAVEVKDFDYIPEGMNTISIGGGSYAVFTHIGPISTFNESIRYIFHKWLPMSAFELDEGPHFTIMGEKYKGGIQPDSEEEIYIPVKDKRNPY